MRRKGWGRLQSDFMNNADAKPQCLQETRSTRVGPRETREQGRARKRCLWTDSSERKCKRWRRN